MTVLPTILRAGVIGIASMVPENSPLDSVVFRSSLQILLGVVYVIVFYLVSALVRVLTGRTALMDPTSDIDMDPREIGSDIEDVYEYNADEPEPHKIPLKSIRRPFADDQEGKEGENSNGLIVRVGQDVERRVRKIVSVVTNASVVLHTEKHAEISCVDDHSPARTRHGSIDDVLSDTSDDSHDSSNTRIRCSSRADDGVGVTRNENQKGSIARIDDGTGVAGAGVNTPPNPAGTDDIHWPKRSPRHTFPASKPSSHIYQGGFPRIKPSSKHSNNNSESLYIKSDRIYTDVYGLGFSAFVLHYTMDCSSMQPTLFLLIGLTCLGARDVSCIALSVTDTLLPQTTLFTRALTVFAFILLVSAQTCMLVGIVRVPSYHADARDGSITEVLAPATVLEHFLARVLPILAPLALYMVSKRTSVASDVAKTLRRAMPTTVLISLWFITCFGAMSERIRMAVGAISVNATVTELSETDVAVNMQIPLLILSPFVKIPALLAIVSCCLTRKTMDVVAALCIVFYAKQLYVVRELEMRQMLFCAFVFACLAWFSLTLRYCTPVVRYVAAFFDKSINTKKFPKSY